MPKVKRVPLRKSREALKAHPYISSSPSPSIVQENNDEEVSDNTLSRGQRKR